MSRKNTTRTRNVISDSDSSSEEESGFFATRPSAMKITKSKWLAFHGESSGSSSSSSEDSGSDSGSSSSESSVSDSEGEIESRKSGSKPANRFLKDSVLASKGVPPENRSSSDQSSDDSFFPSDSDVDDSSDESEDEGPKDPAIRRLRWLKDSTAEKDDKKAIQGPRGFGPEISKLAKKAIVPREIEVELAEEGFRKVGGPKRDEKDLVNQLLGDVSQSNILQKLAEILLARGKKGIERDTVVLALEKLLGMCHLPFQKIKILLSLVSCHFDYPSGASNYLSLKQWKLAASRISSILDLLDENPDLMIREDIEEEDEEVISANLKENGDSAAPSKIRGSLAAVVDRLDEELNKSLLAMDIQSAEFSERLRDELVIYVLLLRSELYVRRIDDNSALYRILLRRIEHMFFKSDSLQLQMDDFIFSKHPTLRQVNSSIHDMCAYLYRNAPDRTRTRAVLCHVYYHAIHDQFYRGRDMLLMSGLQESIRQADIPTQALFNRTMVQLGLCAFRQGLLKECHAALHDILTTGYARDLLNQGYFQVNMELVEAAYQTASMLLEVPFMAANPHDNGRRRVLSKTFRRMLESSERAAFQGPPENTRDHIMAAARALFQGKWRESFQFLSSVRVWAYFSNSNDIKAILETRVKEAGLATWIHSTAACSSALSIEHLTSTFELPLDRTVSLVSQMISNGEIQGKIDGVNNVLIVAPPLTKVQWLSNQIAEKLLHVADGHDKILDMRSQPAKPSKPHHHQNRPDNRQRKNHHKHKNHMQKNSSVQSNQQALRV